MSYRVIVVDRPTREAQIKLAIQASTKTEDFYDFRSTLTALPVVRIPIGLPIYRMENHRTFSAQAEHLSKNNLSADYFFTGQENESVQQVQHEVLAHLASKSKASSVVSAINVLEREGQRESLLITRNGVVVNGNRRLAAMRELFAEDAGSYHHFSHVDCKVLPEDTGPEDILEIEGVLQAKPEVRLDYDWIGDAQLLSSMLKLRGTPEAVAKILGRKPSEIRNVLQALMEADIYLKDWAGAEGKYSLVAEDGEQLFKDLPSQLQGKQAVLQDASRAIAWTLFENRDKLSGRIYNYNVTFGKRAEDVLDRLADELGLSAQGEADLEVDDFDFDIENNSSTDYSAIKAVLKSGEQRERAIETLVEICGSVIESEKGKKSGNAALKSISSANAKLSEVDLSRAAKGTYEAIGRQLQAILDRSKILVEELSKLTGSEAASVE